SPALPAASPRGLEQSHPPLAIGLPSAQRLCTTIGAILAVRHPAPGSMVFEVRIPGRSGEDGVFRWG
ncbi:MAG: hypothetical protein N2322_08270, partial [Terrimicrobiaceae bacterium]|nr:hypothetical protein [Terrimicrobiaceae bacterium]